MKLIVDSSVSLKWWLDDEDYTGEARILLKMVAEVLARTAFFSCRAF